MNKISRETEIDPLELRLLNLKTEDRHGKTKTLQGKGAKQFSSETSPLSGKNAQNPQSQKNTPFEEPVGLEMGKQKEALLAVCKAATFLRKNAVYKLEDSFRFVRDNASPYAPPLRGIALACAYEGTAYLGSNFIKKNLNVELSYTQDKKLYIRGMPISRDIWQIWQRTASEITGIPVEHIFLNTRYSIESEPENPQTTNASIYITLVLIKKACEALVKKITLAEVFPVMVKKSFTVNPRKSWNLETFSGYPFSATSFVRFRFTS